ncbi:gamma-glutamyltransferase family protein [Roseibacterium beibuensis]|uniref:Gamma-glutamyltransferase family protein n=1 Tax=[Roseibacterium] beibuensis TaxID=1193142 RepID=A0ABP9LNG9_9RHOB|nr:gamma-glutamyltransferase family protein [Roseibacterium beibuensis]MCS6626114.1 gamma-glutamyltransferase family protein [Roseibacterium beibuensis]
MRDFHTPGRSAVFAENGICATSHPLAAQTAVSILQQGGNAVDAAIAGAVLLGLCEPAMTGIGGDCFVLVKPAGSEDIIALNGSGRAPAALSGAALREAGHSTMPVFGNPASVTVPGAIDAFCTLSADHGKLGLADILAPAIHYSDHGVPVAPRAAFDWAGHHDNLTGAARDFYMVDGAAPRTGQIFRHPKHGEVLRRIAAQGREAFYEGEVAEDMVASLRALGGVHTLDDFAKTRCDYTTPISGTYKGIELVEHPPNGQGATAILLANILAEFDLPSMEPFGTLRAHIEAEATKLAYDARDRFLSDMDHMTRLAHMLDPATAKKLAALIDPSRAMASAKPLTEAVHKETIYLTVVDRDRMAVSLIYSVFKDFGSGIASDKFGILFQNRGAGFTLEEGHPNEANGGKRTMHTIIPAMLRQNGRVIMPFGVMGGQYQSTGHARMVTNMVDYGLGPQEMIDAPRCFSEYGDMKVETGYSDTVRQELADLGHKVSTPPVGIGGAQAIRIDHDLGVLEGGSDPRKDGIALGY